MQISTLHHLPPLRPITPTLGLGKRENFPRRFRETATAFPGYGSRGARKGVDIRVAIDAGSDGYCDGGEGEGVAGYYVWDEYVEVCAAAGY